jgi:hypothetical protein
MARKVEEKSVYSICVGKAERKSLEELDVSGRKLLKCRTEVHGQDLSSCYEHTNEILCSIKFREFLPS